MGALFMAMVAGKESTWAFIWNSTGTNQGEAEGRRREKKKKKKRRGGGELRCGVLGCVVRLRWSCWLGSSVTPERVDLSGDMDYSVRLLQLAAVSLFRGSSNADTAVRIFDPG